MIWVDGIVPMFCGQAMVTESGERGGESGREEVGRWGFSTLLSSLEISTDTFVILPREKVSVKEKVNEFCPPPCSSVWRCVAHIIVLSYMIVAYCIIMWYINYRALIALIFLYNCNVMVFLPQILKTLSLSQCISLFFCSIYWCWSFLQYALGQWVK